MISSKIHSVMTVTADKVNCHIAPSGAAVITETAEQTDSWSPCSFRLKDDVEVFFLTNEVGVVFREKVSVFSQLNNGRMSNLRLMYKDLPRLMIKIDGNNLKFQTCRIEGQETPVNLSSAFETKELAPSRFLFANKEFVYVGELVDGRPGGEGFSLSSCGYFELFTPRSDYIEVKSFNLNYQKSLKVARIYQNNPGVRSHCQMYDAEADGFKGRDNFQNGRYTLWFKNTRLHLYGDLCDSFIVDQPNLGKTTAGKNNPITVHKPNGDETLSWHNFRPEDSPNYRVFLRDSKDFNVR